MDNSFPNIFFSNLRSYGYGYGCYFPDICYLLMDVWPSTPPQKGMLTNDPVILLGRILSYCLSLSHK